VVALSTSPEAVEGLDKSKGPEDVVVQTASSPPPPSVDKSEIRGLLIQTMGLARASSMPVSSLVRDILREQPRLASERSKAEWMGVVDEVLETNDVFGRVNRVGNDAADKPLEALWFYVPEKDEDQERAMLLQEMMPKKRNETKKHKQYYYRPLGKITRWDAEDEV